MKMTYGNEYEIKNKLAECCRTLGVLEELFEDTVVQFSNRMTSCMGKAYRNHHTMTFSTPLFIRATEGEREQTVVHEIAHLMTFHIFGLNNGVKGHGKEWKKIMRLLGKNPDRCHNVDNSDIRRKVQRVEAKCNCQTFQITKTRATKMRNGSTYRCRSCKTTLVLC